jgi:zinc/manganese transport system substrate-binding protein
MKRRTLLALLPVATAARAQAPLDVVASFTILADMAREIGGDALRVTSLVGPDGDAHSFSPRPSDMRSIAAARVLVRNGLGFEPWLDRVLRTSGFKGTDIVAAAAVQPRRLTDSHGHSHGAGRDPHAWQDPRNALLYVRAIADGLARADAPRADLYRQRADAYAARIRETDAWIEALFAPVPREKRRIITSHDAFGYFGARYGIEFRAAQGVTTEGEPSAQAIATLARQIRRDKIRVVFVENMTNPAIIETLAREAGAVVGGRVFSDALSPPDGPAASYIAMLRHNATLFARAFTDAG